MRAGRGARRGAVPAADRRAASSSPTATTASGRHGHAQGHAGARGRCRDAAAAVGAVAARATAAARVTESAAPARPSARPPGGAAGVLAIGAHADDIEIGCGGTVLRLVAEGRVAVDPLGRAQRRRRARRRRRAASAARFLARRRRSRADRSAASATASSRTPGAAVKEFFEELKATVAPDLVLTHRRDDLHQDHRARRRAHLEHVPRPPDPGVRDPQVRRRPRRPRTSLSSSATRSAERKSTCPGTFVSQANRRGSIPRPSGAPPAPGHGGRRGERPRRGFHCRKALL